MIISIKYVTVGLVSWQPNVVFAANKSLVALTVILKRLLQLLYSLNKHSLRNRESAEGYWRF